MKSIYRKLKEYIYKSESGTTSIFGTLIHSECVFKYDTKEGEWKEYQCCGVYTYEVDFLYEYYVVGIFPIYKIVNDTIVAQLKVCLCRNKPQLEMEEK